MVTGEPVKSPAGGIYPQDILHEEFVDDEDSHIVNDMSRYLSVGYYVPNGRSVSITNGTPTFAYHFVPALQKTETRRRSLRTQHTFRIRQGEVGYLVAMPAQKMNPYQELRFDSCGRLDPLRSSWTWEEQIIPAFSLLILPEAEEGQFDLIEKKLNEYPKYNTCQ